VPLLERSAELPVRLETIAHPWSVSNCPLEELVPWLDVLTGTSSEVEPDGADTAMHNLVRTFCTSNTLMFTS
jgi:hypothetical protein